MKGTPIDLKSVSESASTNERGKASGNDPLAINQVDSLELYTGNLIQSAYFFTHAFGFEPFAYRGPLSGHRGSEHIVLKQKEVHFILSAATSAPHPILDELVEHGFTAKDIALEVPDCVAFYQEAVRRGAESVEPPHEWKGEDGTVRRAQIKTYGNVIHSLVERKTILEFSGQATFLFKMCFRMRLPPHRSDYSALTILSAMFRRWTNGSGFYEVVLGFREMIHFSDDDIATEYSSLMSKVMNDGSGKIKFPINEPAEGKRKSQIEEYLEFHNGAGVQHVALRTDDIVKTVAELKKRGVRFLRVPPEYYEDVPKRVDSLKEDLTQLAELRNFS